MAWEKFDNIRGPKGEKGAPGTISSVTSATVPPGTPARASMTGTTDVNLHLELPQGERGLQGPPGVASSASAKSVPADQQASAKVELLGEATHVYFEVPRGLPGTNGVPTAEAIGANLAAPDSVARPGLEAGMQQVAEDPASAFSTELAARTDAAVDGKLAPAVTALEGKIAQRPTAAQVQAAVSEIAVSVTLYGAKGDGVTDDGPAIQAALDAARNVIVPEGTFIIGQELKIPSNTRFVGVGIDKTILKCSDALDRTANLLTNAKNNRRARTSYDRNIYIADMTLDGNADARPQAPGTWNSGASTVNFSTVEDALVERVRAIKAPLYCFTIDASIYRTTEPAWEYMPGPSRRITIRSCVAEDPRVDDCFTTHYSHDILIEDCVAIRNIPVGSAAIQNGFEVDEGSYRVTLRNCYSRGHETGFQIKGHEDTRPARDVWLYNCVADGCGVGYSLSGTASTKYPEQLSREACNVLIDGCMSMNSVVIGTQGEMLSAMKIYSYSNVTVRDFRSVNSPHGGITMVLAENITLERITGENVWNIPAQTLDYGFIRTTGDVIGDITIRDIEIIGPVSGSVIRQNATGGTVRMDIDGVKATAANGNTYPLCSESFLSPARTYRRLSGTGFTKALGVRGGSGTASVLDEYGPASIIGSGTPEGVIVANPGAMYANKTSSTATTSLYKKGTGTGASGWVAL